MQLDGTLPKQQSTHIAGIFLNVGFFLKLQKSKSTSTIKKIYHIRIFPKVQIFIHMWFYDFFLIHRNCF